MIMVAGSETKSAIITRRIEEKDVAGFWLVSACLLEGCEIRSFSDSEYAFADLKPSSQPFQG